ncbi:hypothetical protein Gain_0008_006 [Komagataeibacter intermedius TF2]|nr:hypothetical protein Gain_0008_006 [Komagataeibacter intermedius TF2]
MLSAPPDTATATGTPPPGHGPRDAIMAEKRDELTGSAKVTSARPPISYI